MAAIQKFDCTLLSYQAQSISMSGQEPICLTPDINFDPLISLNKMTDIQYIYVYIYISKNETDKSF